MLLTHCTCRPLGDLVKCRLQVWMSSVRPNPEFLMRPQTTPVQLLGGRHWGQCRWATRLGTNSMSGRGRAWAALGLQHLTGRSPKPYTRGWRLYTGQGSLTTAAPTPKELLPSYPLLHVPFYKLAHYNNLWKVTYHSWEGKLKPFGLAIWG